MKRTTPTKRRLRPADVPHHGVKRRLFWSFTAQLVTITIRIALQIALVPILLRYWGPGLYQDWLLIVSAVGFLTILDFGMQVYFGNALLIAWSRGNLAAYWRHIGLAMFFYVIVLSLAVLALTAATASISWYAVLGIRVIGVSDLLWTLGLLAVATLVLLPSGVLTSIYRAHGEYGLSTVAASATEVLRGLGVCLVAILGGATVTAAVFYLGVTALYYFCVALDQRLRYAAWPIAFAVPKRHELRTVIAKSGLYAAPTVATPVAMNGPIILLGMLGAAPGAVIAFTISRTFTGLIRQVVFQFGHAVGGEIGRLHAIGDLARLRRLFLSTGRLISGSAGLLGGFAYFVAPSFIRIWTHGAIAYNPRLMALFIATAVLMAPAQVAFALYYYTNKPKILTVAYGGYAIGTVVFCALLIGPASDVGAAAGVGLAEFLSIGLVISYSACLEIRQSFLEFWLRAGAVAGSGLVFGYAVAWAFGQILPPNDLPRLIMLTFPWAAAVVVPALYLLFDSDMRRWIMYKSAFHLARALGARDAGNR